MLKKLAITLCLLIPFNAQAQDFNPCITQVPPNKYFVGEIKLPNRLLYTDNMSLLRKACNVGEKHQVYGCVVESLSNTDVWMLLYDLKDATYNACVLRHELAHVNGWPADHPLE